MKKHYSKFLQSKNFNLDEETTVNYLLFSDGKDCQFLL